MWWKERSGKIRLHQGTSQFKLSTSTFVSLLFELSNRLLYSTPNLIRTNSKLEGFVSLSAPLSMSSVLGSDSLSLFHFLLLPPNSCQKAPLAACCITTPPLPSPWIVRPAPASRNAPFCPTPPPFCNTPSDSPRLGSSGDSPQAGRVVLPGWRLRAGSQVLTSVVSPEGRVGPAPPGAAPSTPQRPANRRRHPPVGVMSSGVRGRSPTYFQPGSQARSDRPPGPACGPEDRGGPPSPVRAGGRRRRPGGRRTQRVGLRGGWLAARDGQQRGRRRPRPRPGPGAEAWAGAAAPPEGLRDRGAAKRTV